MRSIPIAIAITVLMPTSLATAKPAPPCAEQTAAALLQVHAATGTWTPHAGWLTAKSAPGHTLRTEVVRHHQVVLTATWATTAVDARARATKIAGWSASSPKDRVLSPGHYRVRVRHGAQVVAATKFSVEMTATAGRIRTRIVRAPRSRTIAAR